jgi:hypothetical protein
MKLAQSQIRRSRALELVALNAYKISYTKAFADPSLRNPSFFELGIALEADYVYCMQ